MQTFHKTWPAAGVDFYTTRDEYRAICKFADFIILYADKLGNNYKNVHIIRKMYIFTFKRNILKTYRVYRVYILYI